jgi:hypothetical protein
MKIELIASIKSVRLRHRDKLPFETEVSRKAYPSRFDYNVKLPTVPEERHVEFLAWEDRNV